MTLDELNALLEEQGLTVVAKRNQETSQIYEWNCCKKSLEDESATQDGFEYLESKDIYRSLIFKEFCCKNKILLDEVTNHVKDKVVLEVGPCNVPQINFLDCRLRICIEPLAAKIEEFVINKYGKSIFGEIITYPIYADTIIHELIGKIDGLIYVRNCIDHSPQWPYILSNISSYAKEGCILMIWNDTFHTRMDIDPGHYNVSPSVDAYVRLIENFGFSIERQFDFHDRGKPNIGFVARKLATTHHNRIMTYRISERSPTRDITLVSDSLSG